MDTLFKSIFARKTYFEVFKYKEMGITRAWAGKTWWATSVWPVKSSASIDW